MSEFDFSTIGSFTSDDVEAPSAFPIGLYRAALSACEHLQSSQKGTHAICFGVKIIGVEDADEEELEAFGDWQGYEFKPRATVQPTTFFINADNPQKSLSYVCGWDKAQNKFTGFLPEVAGLETDTIKGKPIFAVDADGAMTECLCMEALGSEVLVTIKHETNSDNGRTYAVIDDIRMAPIE